MPRNAARNPAPRNPAPRILAGALVLLVVYYAVVLLTGVLGTSATVRVDGQPDRDAEDYVTLQMKVQDVDLTNRVITANVLPVPHGSLVGERAGEMTRGVRITVASGGVTTSVVTYPGEAIVDPTALTLALDRGDAAYPFDRPFADFQLSVLDEEAGEPVPFEVTMENSARPWTLDAAADSADAGADGALPVTVTGNRDALSVTLVGFYVLAILLTTLMAVVTIGSALIKRQLEFSNVIWLSATMLSFPALRSAMPGAPPIGTAMDFLVFFPCICLIAGMLVWTGAHLLWRESAILRTRDPYRDPEDRDDDADDAAAATSPLSKS